ncbi:MAG: phosphoglycerate mutase, partial [Pseudomonadota bacterium]
MRCTLLISDLLLPNACGSEPYHELRLPVLETLLARGTVVLHPALERDAWLCRAFGVAKQLDWPVAPLTLAADGVAPQHYYWLRADPVELRMEHSRLVMARAVSDLDAIESRELIAALNRHFSRDGITLLAPCPRRWYLRADRAPGIATTPLARAANRDIEAHLPQGDAALDWHRVINEAQMVLHEHAVNVAREARGAATVNSIWLWGGGTVPVIGRPPYHAAWGDDALTRSLAAAAGIARHDPAGDGAVWLTAATAADHDHLLVLDQLSDALRTGGIATWREHLAMLERDWMAPLASALRGRRISAITLVATNSDNLLEATL